ncbi:hypothetical protein P9112_008678 [Eukaryota sp. TZLM1-RC]
MLINLKCLLLLLFITPTFTQLVSLITPEKANGIFLWSSPSSWESSFPTTTSIVHIDGKGINTTVIVDIAPDLNSLHLSQVTLSLNASLEVPGFTSFNNVIVTSSWDYSFDFVTEYLTILGNVDLFLTLLSIHNSCTLSQGQLSLTDSSITIMAYADFIIDSSTSLSNDLQAWGDGSHGRTGTGDTTNPHGLASVYTDQVFTDISAGEDHTLGITSEGTLFAWGNNNYGQLGWDSASIKPVEVAMERVVQISAGEEFSLARTGMNTVYSWGKGDNFRLGHGNSNDQPEPKMIDDLIDVVDISAGNWHGLAVLENGKVKGWGWDHIGQLGLGGNQPKPKEIPINNIKYVYGCQMSSFFLSHDGFLMSTGYNNQGELCRGDNNWKGEIDYIVDYQSNHVISVACGNLYTIFLNDIGEVFSCGSVLGRPAYPTKHSPGKVQGLGRVRSIAAGYNVAFAIDFNDVLHSFESDDFEASPNTETIDIEVSLVEAGHFHYFVVPVPPVSLSSEDDSLMIIDGDFINNSSQKINFDFPIHVGHSGKVTAKSESIIFDRLVQNFGLITAENDNQLAFNGNLNLFDGEIQSLSTINSINSVVTGSGIIHSNLLNYGEIQPVEEIRITFDLNLTESSILSFTHLHGVLVVDSILELNGELVVDYSSLFVEKSNVIDIIIFDSVLNLFKYVSINCKSFITVNLAEGRFITTIFNEIIPDLNQISFISPSGTNEDCCGTASVPCLSLSKIIERMGYYGVVYFEEGEYNGINFDVDLIGVDFELRGSDLDEFVNVNVSSPLVILESTIIFKNLDFSIFDVDDFLIVHSSYLFLDGIFFSSSSSLFVSAFSSNITMIDVEISSNDLINPLIAVNSSHLKCFYLTIFGSSCLLKGNHSIIQLKDFSIFGLFIQQYHVFDVENSEVELTNGKFTGVNNNFLYEGMSMCFFFNSNAILTNIVVQDSSINFLEARTATVSLTSANFSNHQCSLFNNITLSSFKFNNAIVNNSIGQFLLAQDSSEAVFENVTFEQVDSPKPLIEVMDTGFFAIEFLAWNSVFFSLFQSKYSSCALLRTSLTDISLVNGRLLDIDQSFFEIIQSELLGSDFEGISNVFTCLSDNSLIKSVNSTLNFQNSTIASCFFDGNLQFELALYDSTAYFLDFPNILTLTKLSLYNSTIDFNTKQPILIGSISKQNSSITGSDMYLNMDLVVETLEEFQSQHCLPTQKATIDFNFTNAELIEEFVNIQVFNALSESLVSRTNYFSFTVLDIHSVTSLIDYITIDLSSLAIQFLFQLQLPLCPPYLEDFQVPTQGQHVTVSGKHLGHSEMNIFSSTIKISVVDQPINHDHVALAISSGAGCHQFEINRSPDNITSFFSFCFEPPIIHYVTPDPLQLQNILNIHGSNFYNNQSLVDSFFGNINLDFTVVFIDHFNIIFEIHNICNLSLSKVPISVSVANQISNVFDLAVSFPSIEYEPYFLTPSVGEISLSLQINLNLTTLSLCNDIMVDGNVPLEWDIADFSIFTLDLELSGIDYLQLFVQLSSSFSQLIHIPVIDFAVQPSAYLCLTNQICNITICISSDSVDINQYHPLGGNNLLILDFSYSDKGCISISLVFQIIDANSDLQLCNSIFCNKITEIPPVIQVNSLNPQQIQWQGRPTTATLVLSGLNFGHYSSQFILKSMSFHSVPFEIVEVNPYSIVYDVIFEEFRRELFQYHSYNTTIDLFIVACDNFISIPPISFVDSEVILFSNLTYSVSLLVGNEIFEVSTAQNSLLVHNAENFSIGNYAVETNLIRISHFPNVVLITSNYTLDLDLIYSNLDISAFCFNDCCSLSYSFVNSLLTLNILGTEATFCTLELEVAYGKSAVVKHFEFFISHEPSIELLSKNYFSTGNNTLEVSIGYDTPCIDDYDFAIGGLHLSFSKISDTSTNNFCNQHLSIDLNLPMLYLRYPIYFGDLIWVSSNFGHLNVEQLKFFNIDLFSNSTVSVFEPRNLLFTGNVNLPDPIYCQLHDLHRQAHITNNVFECPQILASSYQNSVTVEIYYIDLLITTIDLAVEPFFVDRCFVSDHVSLIQNFQVYGLHYSKSYLPQLFDQHRCCSNDDCFVLLNSGQYFSIKFDGSYDVISLMITTNSSCTGETLSSPITISNLTSPSLPIRLGNTTNEFWICESLLNGFDDALMCSIEFNLQNITQITLASLAPVEIFEIEVYGYKTFSCLHPVNDFVGVTSSGTFLEVDGLYSFNGFESPNFHSFFPIIQSNLIDSILDGPLQVSYSFSSNDCYYPTTDLTRMVYPTAVSAIQLINSTILTNLNSFILEFNCFDLNGFLVNCNVSNVTMIATSFNYQYFEVVSSNSLKFHLLFSHFGTQSITFSIGSFVTTLFFDLWQELKSILIIQTIDSHDCSRRNLFLSSCTLFKLSSSLLSQQHLSNFTTTLELFDLSLHSNSEFMTSLYSKNQSYLEISGIPLVEYDVIFNYNSAFASVLFTLNDCDSTRMNLNNECHCKPGTVLGSVGECEPCQLGYYLDNPLVGECINCPIGKITKSIGSSNSTECVCPKSQFDDGKGCIKCPKFSTCKYGELASVSNGYKFTLETGSISCPYRYSCRNNQCRFNTKGIDCTECIEGTKRYGFVCIGTSGFEIFLAISCNIILILLLLVSQHYLKLCYQQYRKIKAKYLIPSLDKKAATKLIQSKGQTFCPLLVVMVVSLVITDSPVSVTFPFSFAISLFGNSFSFVLPSLFYFILYKICTGFLIFQFSFSKSYFGFITIISCYLGMFTKFSSFHFDLEFFLLLITFFSLIFLIIPLYKADQVKSVFAFLFLLSISKIPVIFYFIIQCLMFFTLCLFSGLHNTILSFIGTFVSCFVLTKHVYFA